MSSTTIRTRKPRAKKPPKPETWDAAIALYVAYLERPGKRKSPHTVDAYTRDLAKFATWFKEARGKALRPDLVDEDAAADWSEALEEKYEKSGVNRRLASLRAFNNWAAKLRWMPLIEMPDKQVQQESPPLSLNDDDEITLIQTARETKSTQKLLVILVGSRAGLRVSEIADLKWSDVKITADGGELTVRHGKGDKKRTVEIEGKDLRKAFLKHGYDKHRGSDDFVFQGQRETKGLRNLSAKALSSIARELGRKAWGKDSSFTIHHLRHTFCTRLADAGVPIETIAELAGHANIQTTRRYLKASKEKRQAAVNKLADKRRTEPVDDDD
jgi:integrase/recombinase XerD